MRAVSKLCLNSLWGKFGQRINQTQTEYVTEPKDFYKILLNETHKDINVQFLRKDMVQMSFYLKDKFVDNYNNMNIFAAAFTTSHARKMLYGVLDKLGNQVLGYDTDSCWFVDRSGGNTIETGDSLGELTDELDSGHIVKWVGTGLKSCAYETNNGEVMSKVKGFTLNYSNGLKINADVMDEIIRDPSKKITIGRKNAITRDAKNKAVVNQDITKTLMTSIRYPTDFKSRSKFFKLKKFKKMSANEIKNRTVYMLCRTDKTGDDGSDIYIGSMSQYLEYRLCKHRYRAKTF